MGRLRRKWTSILREASTWDRTRTGPPNFSHANWLGTELLRTGPTGSVLRSCIGSLPFGDGESCSGNVGSYVNGISGLWLDDETSLAAAAYRNYSATSGRWLTPDPAGLAAADPGSPQSWNRYGYVNNSPLSFTDPLGLNSCDRTCMLANSIHDLNDDLPFFPQTGFNCEVEGMPAPCGVANGLVTSGAGLILGTTSPLIFTPGGSLCQLHGWQGEYTWYECSGGISAGDPRLVGGAANNGSQKSKSPARQQCEGNAQNTFNAAVGDTIWNNIAVPFKAAGGGAVTGGIIGCVLTVEGGCFEGAVPGALTGLFGGALEGTIQAVSSDISGYRQAKGQLAANLAACQQIP
jgi:RHS repeat-associated protein